MSVAFSRPGLLLAALLLCIFHLPLAAQSELRAPAYPLVTHNPNFSIWSMGDTLNAMPTKHWTETDHGLLGLVQVDDTFYRFMGSEPTLYETVLAAADEGKSEVRYTESQPAAAWM